MRARGTLERIVREYPDDVQIVFKHHPLSNHKHADLAARAAIAAQRQGKFPAMHDKLLENGRALSPGRIRELAAQVGLDAERFEKDLEDPEVKARVARETKEVVSIGATGTPASFVNGRYVRGAKPFETFKELIDEEIAWAKAGNRPAFTTGTNVRALQGRTRAARKGPDPSRRYELPVGNAPSLGPGTARVTIQHYLDYQ